MCGIFGVFSNSLVVKSILDGLSKLEYRGMIPLYINFR